MTTNFINKPKSRVVINGFTLVETLVALSILLVAVSGPISLIGDSLHKMYFARDETLAVNLAQEGIESVRQVRDTNMLSGSPWLTNLSDGAYTADAGALVTNRGVIVTGGNDGGSGSLIPCGPTCLPQPVYLDATTGLYRQQGGGARTQFTRVITISSTGLTAAEQAFERRVTSDVIWKTGGTTGTVSAQEYIFSWAI
jgi:prepilin-type N-terminal cleavage/methylation domain-containing protein